MPGPDKNTATGFMSMISVTDGNMTVNLKKYSPVMIRLNILFVRGVKWLGGSFDPEYFNKDKINELLKEGNYGCIEIPVF